jgi:hypothetical protein
MQVSHVVLREQLGMIAEHRERQGCDLDLCRVEQLDLAARGL